MSLFIYLFFFFGGGGVMGNETVRRTNYWPENSVVVHKIY